MKKHLVLVLSLLVISIFISGCQKNAEGRRVLQLMPAQNLQSQAAQMYQQQIDEAQLSNNARQKAIVQRVTDRITRQAELMYGEHCRGFIWEVNLIQDDETVNAYCMPGGKMAVYTGMLKVAENEAALAAVMGHEVAHALLEHANERMTYAKGAELGLLVGQVAINEAKLAEGQYDRYLVTALGLGAQFGILLPYSRTHESEADRMGLRLSASAGYAPKEAPLLWQRMKASGGGSPQNLCPPTPVTIAESASFKP